jgi:5'-AMP-activated protein kinase catalytic alpha subunit
VIGPIAQGAFSQVLRARRTDDESQVAIKCFNMKRMLESPEEQLGMRRELEALRALSHPYVMQLHSTVDGASTTYAIMEYLGGGSLRLVLNQRMSPLPEPAVAAIVAQLASALAHCHECGIIHRDVKSANVLFADSSRTCVKLVDFGFAMPWTEGSRVVLPKCGTPSHMAPELHLRKSYDGRRADVFALGVLTFEMLHLLLPYDAPNMDALKMRVIKGHRRPLSQSLSLGARSLVNAMLTTNPPERPDAARVCSHPWLPQSPPPSTDGGS